MALLNEPIQKNGKFVVTCQDCKKQNHFPAMVLISMDETETVLPKRLSLYKYDDTVKERISYNGKFIYLKDLPDVE